MAGRWWPAPASPETASAAGAPVVETPRDRKFRQAAWVYLHVGLLYEAAAYTMMREGLMPTGGMDPAWAWLLAGAAIALLVFWGLLKWKNKWFARAIWALHALRLPTLISGAFFRGTDGQISPSFYLTALVIVIINLAFLARAGWDI